MSVGLHLSMCSCMYQIDLCASDNVKDFSFEKTVSECFCRKVWNGVRNVQPGMGIVL